MSMCVSTAQARPKRSPRRCPRPFFLYISTQNGSCDMSMCVSTAPARTKRCPRRCPRPFFFTFPHKMALVTCPPCFPVNFHKMALVTCPCAFRLRRLAQRVLPGLGIGFPPQHHPPQHHHLPPHP